ncbi:MAG: hypothetical protein HQ551_08355 [Desulfobacteraceae bacterium]|nr:hypothetical protein [Desulfobacteraceae bacterium]
MKSGQEGKAGYVARAGFVKGNRDHILIRVPSLDVNEIWEEDKALRKKIKK